MELKNILIVDDEPVNLKILKAMLTPEGYNVIEAENGTKALDVMSGIMPDIILLDVMMPEMDGFEVCRRIKAQKDKRMIPILMVTALQDKVHRQQAMEAGADDFLSKPIDKVELLIRVKSLLRIKTYSDELVRSYKILEEKNRQLEELEKVKEGLIHMIIHDLRGPLTNISMNIDVSLMKLPPDSGIEGYLSNASRQCVYMNDMIQGLLDIHKIEEGRLEIAQQPLDVRELIEEMAENYRPQAEASHIGLKWELDSTVACVSADPGMTRRIISNLLDNAIRHTPKGGQVFISASDSSDGRFVVFTVSDSGEGLDEKYRERIFDKFEQVNLKKRGIRTGSTGLGLAFCKMATELHGGRIWVSDGPGGRGCAFSFTLPAANATLGTA